MFGRLDSLMKPAALLFVLLATTGNVYAHRLEAEYRVLPGQKVQVESWFDSTGDSPKGATVEVFRAGKQLLTTGQLDEKGVFVFAFTQAEPLTVVISAGAGHRKELTISMTDLLQNLPGEMAEQAPDALDPPVGTPRADRSSRVTVKDVLVGLSFLLALAAFILSVRNARQLRDLTGR
jgi:nickel transport protein